MPYFNEILMGPSIQANEQANRINRMAFLITHQLCAVLCVQQQQRQCVHLIWHFAGTQIGKFSIQYPISGDFQSYDCVCMQLHNLIRCKRKRWKIYSFFASPKCVCETLPQTVIYKIQRHLMVFPRMAGQSFDTCYPTIAPTLFHTLFAL